MTNVTAQPLDRCKATVVIDGNKKVCLTTQGGIWLDRLSTDIFCQTSGELVQAVTWLLQDYGFAPYENLSYNSVHTDPAYTDVDVFLSRITYRPETLEEGYDGTISIVVRTYPAESQLVVDSEPQEDCCEGLSKESIEALPVIEDSDEVDPKSLSSIERGNTNQFSRGYLNDWAKKPEVDDEADPKS